eukprot:7113712-Pyramimonas_sp.AAC.1
MRPKVVFITDISQTMTDGHRLQYGVMLMANFLARKGFLARARALFDVVTYHTTVHSWVQGCSPAQVRGTSQCRDVAMLIEYAEDVGVPFREIAATTVNVWSTKVSFPCTP